VVHLLTSVEERVLQGLLEMVVYIIMNKTCKEQLFLH
jgi:hypothetical protein